MIITMIISYLKHLCHAALQHAKLGYHPTGIQVEASGGTDLVRTLHNLLYFKFKGDN